MRTASTSLFCLSLVLLLLLSPSLASADATFEAFGVVSGDPVVFYTPDGVPAVVIITVWDVLSGSVWDVTCRRPLSRHTCILVRDGMILSSSGFLTRRCMASTPPGSVCAELTASFVSFLIPL